ncbi:hypothetical protein N0B44_18175 [Roseibacterium beibuensis]|uniref:hypothetical protein n=1 Tax=[Roseibacterium] beibuensis TaxID=1193142 RepID=UPI00217D9AF1|nr:hypothetical protein [Roseibacterium beibuensis]MCS6624847.1 hypothetical protein [Roseibacterium beibuensis]
MTDMVRAINPTAAISNAEEAKAAARASAIAIFLGVVWGIIGVAWLMGPGAAVMEAAMAEAAAGSPEAAGMTDMMAGAALGFAGVMVVIQLILGLVQWFKPNIVIPILFTVFVVYGLGSTALGMAMADQMELGAAAATPAWQTWGGIALMVVQLIMHIAGIRGASAMRKFRDAQAY